MLWLAKTALSRSHDGHPSLLLYQKSHVLLQDSSGCIWFGGHDYLSDALSRVRVNVEISTVEMGTIGTGLNLGR
jgi:hypothetical protein